MPKFLPVPNHDEDWWMNVTQPNIIGFDDEMCSDLTDEKPGNWVAYAYYTSEMYPPAMGYRVIFPTSTDCLYWIRWIVLPDSCELGEFKPRNEIIFKGKVKEFADTIDQFPDYSNSKEILNALKQDICLMMSDKEKEILFIGSLVEFKKSLGD